MSGVVKVVYVVETRHRRRDTLKWSRWQHNSLTVDRDTALGSREQYSSGPLSPVWGEEWQARVVPFDRRKR